MCSVAELEHPLSEITFRFTEKVPATLYLWPGLVSADVLVSPKFQLLVFMLPVAMLLVDANRALSLSQVFLYVKDAEGLGYTVTD